MRRLRDQLKMAGCASALRAVGGLTVVLTAGYVVAFCLWLLSGWGGRANVAVIADGAFLPMSSLAAILSWRTARRRGLNRRSAQAWRLIGISYLCYWAGDVGWFYFDAVRGARPYPSLADIGYLSFYPFLAAGLLRLPATRRNARERAVLGLDTATVTIGSFLVIWYLIIDPTIRADTTNGTAWLARTLDVAYPLGDVLVVFAVAVVLLRGATAARDSALLVLTAGLVIFVAADVIYSRMSLDGAYSDGSWVNALWMAGQGLTIISAHLALRQPVHPDLTVTNRARHVSRLPFAAIAGALTLLLVVSIQQLPTTLVELVAGVVALTAIVAVRQLTALQENRRLLVELRHAAATDHLTGVASRAQFFATAEAALSPTRRQTDTTGLLMIDVDHFKHVNDTHGHADGDTVLQHITARILGAVRAGDLVARYGGDEIVVLLPSCPETAQSEIAERITRAVRDTPIPGTNAPIHVTVSIGGSRSDTASTLADALARADRALYRAKHNGRNNWTIDTQLSAASSPPCPENSLTR
jgi:diguanylate cyclase (GGDEF)-like protein